MARGGGPWRGSGLGGGDPHLGVAARGREASEAPFYCDRIRRLGHSVEESGRGRESPPPLFSGGTRCSASDEATFGYRRECRLVG